MSVRRSMSWALASQIVTLTSTLGSAVVIAHLLSPSEVGVNALAVAALGIVQAITSVGLSSFVVRDAELKPETLDLAFSMNATFAILLAMVMLATSFAAEPILGDRRSGEVMMILAIAPLINIFSFRGSALLQREMRFRAFSMVTAAISVCTSTLTIAFALSGSSYKSAAYAGLIAALLGVVLYRAIDNRFGSARFTFRGGRIVLAYSLQVMSISGVALLATRLSELILGRTLGVAALGIYSRASLINNVLFENVYGTATRVAFAKLAHDYRSSGSIRATFLRALYLILGVMWPMQLGLATLSGPLVVMVFGERWAQAGTALSILLIAQAIVISFGMNWELFVVRGETKTQSRIEFVRAGSGLFAFVIGCSFGLTGAAAARVVDAVVGSALYSGHVKRLADLDAGELAKIYRANLVVTACAVGPALVLMFAYDWSYHVPVPAVFAAVFLGMLGWGAALMVLRHPLVSEFQVLLARFRGTSTSAEGG